MLVTLALAAGHAGAHGIWFAQRGGDLALVYGEGAEDLDTAKRATKIRHVAAYDAAGESVATGLAPVGRLLFVDLQQKPAVVAAVLDNGFWTKGPEGKWFGKTKDAVPGAQESGRYLKYAVHLRAPLKAPLAALPDHALQIVPVAAALPQHKDDDLQLRVQFRGQPVAGAEVIADFVGDPDGEPLRTDAHGLVTVKVRNQGLNVIVAKHSTAPDDAALADKTEHLASLSFALGHRPE
ncbi:DUF4198 domain-containing protein [Denitromonas iodatirespirans]|uniref:DUF4198 domain-containing protein n=1 Tax=Denitromonas iodatirespirans TaxID=2795389 RepID=A0A944DG97_DENI1|nr:DUF4198 domain-containing protein [Denitromonas iodatirespirans]MBT0962283.1 DUF4198 domain-containing protein [Denitromonas iodatirespirans]